MAEEDLVCPSLRLLFPKRSGTLTESPTLPNQASSDKRFQSPWPDSNNISLTFTSTSKNKRYLVRGSTCEIDKEYKLNFACQNNSALECNWPKIDVLVS
jgi:hypothetical protein